MGTYFHRPSSILKSNLLILFIMYPSLRKLYFFMFTISILFMRNVSFQYSELVKEYYLMCGADYLCFDETKTKVDFFDIVPEYSYRHLGLCPECSCDKQCIRRGDCCPDLFFTFPETECVNRTIIKGVADRAREQRYSEFMITKCPDKTEPEIKLKCENNTDIKSRLVNFPVTGRETPLTFYNTYCAECHGFTELELWNLDIQCRSFADFNYLSTIDEIIKIAFESVCNFQTYYPHDQNIIAPNCFEMYEDRTLFSKCNQTGNWKIFDAAIKHSCESYPKVKYRLFKNIFCYMCNPSIDETEEILISDCNMTGQWKIYDEGLRRACVELPYSSSVKPFKNIFCYICNRGNYSSEVFVDVKSSIQEFVTEDDHFRFQYNIKVEEFNFEYLKHLLALNVTDYEENNKEVYRPLSDSTITLTNGTLINIENLVNQAAALDLREIGVCPKRRLILPPAFNSNCLCDPKCLYRDIGKCCADLALELRTTCVDQLALSNITEFRKTRKGYLLINGCLQERTHSLFQDGCSQRHMNNVFSILPVTHKDRDISYNNLFCVLCNMESVDYVDALNGYIQFQTFDETKEEDKKKHISSILEDAEVQKYQYTIWDLDITCPTYLDFSHHVKLGDLLPVARKQNCRILYKTNVKESDVCDQRPYNDCNESSDWSYTDTDVQWSCKNTVNFPSFFSPAIPDIYPNIDVPWRNKTQRPESLFLYQNVFCALCSPLRYFSIDPVDTCNVTGMARPSDLRDSMDMKCQQSPFIYYYYPFKNHFCVLCNGIPIMSAAEGSIPSDIQQYDRAPGITWYPLLRNLFSIEQDNAIMEDVRVQDSPVCMKDQFFDFTEERCRNLTCFAGKFLQGEECQPLLKITNNLRYSLRLLVSAIPHHQQRAVDLLPIGVSHVGDYLMTSLFDEGVFISHTSVKGNQSCENTTDLSTPLFFELYVELFFVRSVFRHELEIKILNINQGSLSGTDVFSSIEFITDTNQSRLFRQSTESCMLAFPTHPRAFAMNTDRYYIAKISDVLLCPQVEISNEEYNISDDQSQITLLKLGVEVDRRQFDVTSDGQMRLCYEYLSSLNYFGQNAATRKEGVLVVPEPSLKYLWIVSLICSITSIVGLLLGLVVYCLFPVLRTTPGKLMISLMVSLFLTLLFQSLSFFMISTDVGCKIVGVVSHLTWLSVFTSMQVCNFHMYKVFSSNKPVRSNQTTRCFNKTILLYMLYILCVPILIVILNMVLSKTISHNSLFGYGGAKCFMDNTVSVISAFLCPVLLICISNILLYFLTIRIIHYTPNPAGNEQHRNELTIFTRLATITGISWIFQVIDSFLPLTFFSYIAAAVNSLQGLFVFIAFVVNKRTAVLMKAKFFRKDHRHTANTSKSASSTTANRSGTNSSMTTITKL